MNPPCKHQLIRSVVFVSVSVSPTMSPILGFDLLSKNVSLFTIPAFFVAACLGPHAYAISAADKTYDISNPRFFLHNVAKDESIDKTLRQRIIRAEGASQNGFENLGFFASGVVAANVAGLDGPEISALSLGYLVARLAYVFTYVHLGANRRLAPVRSLVYMASTGLLLTIWVRAGLKLLQQ
ncbi:Membrane associated eicosanoid/glutathione metabolism-like domain-containingprotein [Purpureocillium lavendulum]|uniref:Membrane associated eicosanoid/glutathione metabolism-like domain-containingprotein n=1 Tax=Purpureocillium lavendulum TaxID=1247861 RepID=A0AB34G3Y0_9HYPO|nr:Membrane associated eicosanoid/glutathione metabolism-like domain-containingprotein [Purpureocillium lavendulum]